MFFSFLQKDVMSNQKKRFQCFISNCSNVQVYINSITSWSTCSSRKYPYPHHRRSLDFRESMKVNRNIQRAFRGKVLTEKNLCGGKGYFLGQRSIILIIFCIVLNKL